MNVHAAALEPLVSLPDAQRVTSVTHWTDQLFSFRLTRPASLRFRSGEFVMIGLPGGNGKPIMRAYSIASPAWDDTLEFYSIKVPNGPLTSRLKNIQVDDSVILRPKAVGTLVLDALRPGKRLFLIATGTGIAPFASWLRDSETYEKFDQVILTHTCRGLDDLAYGRSIVEGLSDDPLVGDIAPGRLVYCPTTTRDTSPYMGRVTRFLESGDLPTGSVPRLNAETDRVMICGSIGLNQDVKEICERAGLQEGSNSQPGDFVREKAFVG